LSVESQRPVSPSQLPEQWQLNNRLVEQASPLFLTPPPFHNVARASDEKRTELVSFGSGNLAGLACPSPPSVSPPACLRDRRTYFSPLLSGLCIFRFFPKKMRAEESPELFFSPLFLTLFLAAEPGIQGL